jgi:L-rhamnose-H+ transport protein
MTLLGFFAFFLFCLAGIINGSYAFPLKSIKGWQFENIFLNYAVWAFLILPWLFFFILYPHALDVYQQASIRDIGILLIGGLLFGVGQICFTLALRMIGLGLSFVLNIGIGTGLGFLAPLVFLHSHQLATAFGLVTILGTVLIIAGLIFCFVAGRHRNRKQHKTSPFKKENYLPGVMLAATAGIFSAGQNFTFASTASMQTLALHLGVSSLAAANVIWPMFLLFASIPYIAYMLYLHKKEQSFQVYQWRTSVRYIPIAFVMGLFWYGSLILYSLGSHYIGKLGPVIGWPLFMVTIILTSNFWGWRHGEWTAVGRKIFRQFKWGIGLLVIAVVVLALSVMLAH